jgi:phage protein D
MSGNSKTAVATVTWKDRPLTGVKSVEVEDHDQLIDKATIILDDAGRIAPTTAGAEETIKIEMGWDGQTAVLFEGIVVGGGGQSGQKESQAKIVAYDFSMRMHRKHVNQSIAEKTKLSELVKKIAANPDYKFADADIHLDLDDDPVLDRNMCEPNTTDLQFLQKLAREYQCRAFVEYNAPDKAASSGKSDHSQFYFWSLSKIMQKDPVGTLYFCPSVHQLLDFRYQRIASGADPERQSSAIDDKTGALVSSPAEPTPGESALQMPEDVDRDLPGVSDNADKAAQAVVDEASSNAGKPHDQVKQTNVCGTASDGTIPSKVTKRDPTRLMGVQGEGTSTGNIDIRAKSKLTLIGISPWYEGDWYVKVVRHKYEMVGKIPSYTTRFLATR